MLDRIADGRTDLVFDHVARGGSADATDAGGVSLLQWCAYYGDVSAIRLLIERGVPLDALGDNLDLNGAAFHGHWQLCQFLIEQGADVNLPLPDTGETPLHAALCTPNRPVFTGIVRILLAHGADPNHPTTPGVDTGCFMRDVRTRAETPLHRAAAFGTGESIDALIDAGADLTARDVNGDSPLGWASWHRRPAFILSKLCFGDHTVHPKAVAESRSDWAVEWGRMEHHLLGRPHV